MPKGDFTGYLVETKTSGIPEDMEFLKRGTRIGLTGREAICSLLLLEL